MFLGPHWLGFSSLLVQAGDRRRLVEWTTDLRHLTAEEFEWLVGEVFRREGWTVYETGRQGHPDGGVDLELVRDGQRRIVQCKRWAANFVGVKEVREFGGTLRRECVDQDAGIVVTLRGFTEDARTEANQMGITLIDSLDLYSHVERVRRVESCPLCQAPMKLGYSSRGWWLRCVTGRCTGKRDLGSDPVQAVEHLTRLR